MIGKRLINTGVAAPGAFVPSEHFETVTYTGNGGTQRIGGYINRGAVFNGSTSSYIEIPSTPTTPIDFSSEDFTISMWVNPASLSSAMTLLGKYSSSSDSPTTKRSIRIQLETTGQVSVLEHDGSAAYTQTSTNTISANTWSFIGYTRNATTSNIYIDNNSAESQARSNTIKDGSTQSITLGGSRPSNGSLNGKLDQVRFFNKALSAGEVSTLYGETYASSTVSTTDIFNDDSGVALYQLDGNANDTGRGAIDSGQSAEFNGGSSKIDLPVLGLGGGVARSVSAWIKTTNNNTTQFIFGSGTQAAYQVFGIQLSPTGKVSVSYSGSQLDTTTAPIINNKWHHIVATFSGGSSANTTLYVDGVSQSLVEIGTAGTVNTGNQNYAIGYNSPNPGAPFYFNGQIDDVRIYSDVLTSTEVGYLFNNTTASIPTDNFVAYYKLDNNANDSQGSNNGTATSITYSDPAEFPPFNGTATNVTYQEATKFQPDFVWIKERTSTSGHHIGDSVRGATKMIYSNLTNAESTDVNTITSFDSNGFTVGSSGGVNAGTDNYVAWCFKGGGTAVSNTDGNVTTTVSANVDAGFSIVKYFGGNISNTYGHGLDSAPELIIIKNLDIVRDWSVVGTALGGDGGNRLVLNDTVALITTTGLSGTTDTTFAFEHNNSIANSANNFISYCFHSVEGFSKIGTYTGTGAAGNAIVTGFEPQFILLKPYDQASTNWIMLDNERETSNPRKNWLKANTAEVEGTTAPQGVNFLSNGFDFSGFYHNDLNWNFIYLAIAADPDTTTPVVENSFDVVTYTGNSTNDFSTNLEQSITTVDFKPDLVWIKNRNSTYNHGLFDSVRGATNYISSATTSAQISSNGYLKSFDGNGFGLGGDYAFNRSGYNYVAWCWKAGDHDDNLPQINTEGTIDSIVSVNAAAGFSIVKYKGNITQGATVGHGLSSAPEMIIVKGLDNALNWIVYHTGIGASNYIQLNTDGASVAQSSYNMFNSTAPSSTLFTLGNIANTNGSGLNYIAYCFHSVSGYQKIGSYTGTGSAGNSVNVGFAPRWVMIKKTNAAYNWNIYDTLRGANSDGTSRYMLLANSSDAEFTASTVYIDITSTGFSFPNAYSGTNNLNDTYIYLAIK